MRSAMLPLLLLPGWVLPACVFIDASARSIRLGYADESAADTSLDSETDTGAETGYSETGSETGDSDTGDSETGDSETGDTDTGDSDTAGPGPFPSIRVEAGTYPLGSPSTEVGRNDDEAEREVALTHPFEIGVYELTVAEWEAVAGTTLAPGSTGCADCPMESVTWNEAALWANLLSEAEGLDGCYTCTGTLDPHDGSSVTCAPEGSPYECEGWRLPAEAEWEVAARAGSFGALPSSVDGGDLADGAQEECDAAVSLSDGTVLGDLAWYCGSATATHPVGRLAPNAWGLYDVAGNVAEWVHDGYVDEPGTRDPYVNDGAAGRVWRGGGFDDVPATLRSANRGVEVATSYYLSRGLRLARTVE